MVFPESMPVISGCRIVNNSYGVTIVDTAGRIENTYFENNSVAAIWLDGSADAEMSGNSFQHNGEDVKEGISTDQCCFTSAFVLLILGVVSLLVLVMRLRRDERADEK